MGACFVWECETGINERYSWAQEGIKAGVYFLCSTTSILSHNRSTVRVASRMEGKGRRERQRGSKRHDE